VYKIASDSSTLVDVSILLDVKLLILATLLALCMTSVRNELESALSQDARVCISEHCVCKDTVFI
jgi:hypothetical protein